MCPDMSGVDSVYCLKNRVSVALHNAVAQLVICNTGSWPRASALLYPSYPCMSAFLDYAPRRCMVVPTIFTMFIQSSYFQLLVLLTSNFLSTIVYIAQYILFLVLVCKKILDWLLINFRLIVHCHGIL